jgi:hypothetical protein
VAAPHADLVAIKDKLPQEDRMDGIPSRELALFPLGVLASLALAAALVLRATVFAAGADAGIIAARRGRR